MSGTNRLLTGYRFVQIRYGDTLQALAAREIGDANKWRDLVSINSLTWPFVTGDKAVAGPSVKLYGDFIVIPATVTQISAQVDPDAVFGTDLALTNGFLTADSGDFASVSGRANLKQALHDRVETDLRELLFHPEYGCGARRLIGTVNGPTAALLAGQYVKAALLNDDRVASVPSTKAQVIGDALPVSANVVPIAGAPVPVEARL